MVVSVWQISIHTIGTLLSLTEHMKGKLMEDLYSRSSREKKIKSSTKTIVISTSLLLLGPLGWSELFEAWSSVMINTDDVGGGLGGLNAFKIVRWCHPNRWM